MREEEWGRPQVIRAGDVGDVELYIFSSFPAREPGPPSFKKPSGEMQQLASGYMGHRIELFCPANRG